LILKHELDLERLPQRTETTATATNADRQMQGTIGEVQETHEDR